MIEALKRLWRGSDLPRGQDGRPREPGHVRDGGVGALSGTHEEYLKHPPLRVEEALLRPIEAMTRERFESMPEQERLTWWYGRMRYEAPQHNVVLGPMTWHWEEP